MRRPDAPRGPVWPSRAGSHGTRRTLRASTSPTYLPGPAGRGNGDGTLLHPSTEAAAAAAEANPSPRPWSPPPAPLSSITIPSSFSPAATTGCTAARPSVVNHARFKLKRPPPPAHHAQPRPAGLNCRPCLAAPARSSGVRRAVR